MTLYDHSSEDIITRQEAFEQLVKERLQYAVRIAFINVLEEEVTAFIGAKPYERSHTVEINAMDTTAVIWTPPWEKSLMCPFLAREEGITRSCLSVIIAAATSWMAPCKTCSSKE
ncbi:hypothetical protein KSB_88560 [Ktedonobacter robiniae]|uniref:Uncharacterized protein n=1 Tax=Ktedonobacter robiniae TaxID=2778365 RepID=A0ABQ3V5B5_9CHLR|nr:hypothetical protein KSB_88560 [Ktedonobacter robiniae]